jgi:hypothetical protein
MINKGAKKLITIFKPEPWFKFRLPSFQEVNTFFRYVSVVDQQELCKPYISPEYRETKH